MPRAWLGAITFFCDCTYLELKRIESWRGGSCHCGRNELHRVVITCWRKSTGWWVEVEVEGDTYTQYAQVETMSGWGKCQHSSCGLACTQPRHPAQTSALTKESAGYTHVGFTRECLSISTHLLLLFIFFIFLSVSFFFFSSVSQLCVYNALCSVSWEYLFFLLVYRSCLFKHMTWL